MINNKLRSRQSKDLKKVYAGHIHFIALYSRPLLSDLCLFVFLQRNFRLLSNKPVLCVISSAMKRRDIKESEAYLFERHIGRRSH